MIHQFAPVDSVISVTRFLNHWKPSICLISELDLWPMRIIEAKKYGIPLTVDAEESDRLEISLDIFEQVLKTHQSHQLKIFYTFLHSTTL